VKVELNGGERDVDDGDVHTDEQEAAAADGEDDVGMGGAGVGRGHWGGTPEVEGFLDFDLRLVYEGGLNFRKLAS